MKLRISEYNKTGNLEFLIDAANFLMMEFMNSKHPKHHFEATDSSKSPGRIWGNERKGVQDRNDLKDA